MTLRELFALFGQEAPSLPVAGLTHDSREVQPGFLFVAIPGLPSPHRPPRDGHQFIPEALRRGAIAVVGSQPLELPVPYLRVDDSRSALADLAAAFFGYPARLLRLVGITGTKGKTTVSHLLHYFLEQTAPPVGLISSLSLQLGSTLMPSSGHFTTPEAPTIQQALRTFVDHQAREAVLEVSSHALALERVRGISYDLGIWTNLEPEHLDFHGTMEAYFAAKRKLIERSRFALLNREDPYYPRLAQREHWSFGQGGDWQGRILREEALGSWIEVTSPYGRFETYLPLPGRFNLLNALAALAGATFFGRALPELLELLPRFPGVPGRMEQIQEHPFRVIVDFAHTETSLRAALTAVRKITPGRILLVIGAAGERGLERREGLGKAAGELADLTFFTEEDSRSEPLEEILEALACSARSVGGSFRLIPDRREAIRQAIAEARPGDTVILAGKGRERTLERAQETLEWNEVEEVRRALHLD